MPNWQRFYKVSKRVLDDISTVAGAFALDLGPGAVVTKLRIAYGGIAATPLRAVAVEHRAQGLAWTRDTLAILKGEMERVGTPMTDARGSAAYRAAVATRLLERFFHETASPDEGTP
jgi:xanthine dehydrogenase small subunit